MLPGFRFLFAAILLSMSILVFGLGAVALLRAAHEEVASTPACEIGNGDKRAFSKHIDGIHSRQERAKSFHPP